MLQWPTKCSIGCCWYLMSDKCLVLIKSMMSVVSMGVAGLLSEGGEHQR